MPPGAEDAAAIFFELMICDLDYARWVAGDVASVYAARSGGGPGYALAVLKHHGGAITHVEASWAKPLVRTITEVEIAGSLGLVGFRSEATRPISLRIDPGPMVEAELVFADVVEVDRGVGWVWISNFFPRSFQIPWAR